MMPRFAAHESAIRLHAGLFARIDALHRRRNELGSLPRRCACWSACTWISCAKGRGSGDARKRHAEIAERLATLYTRFRQNVLADEAGFRLVLREEADLAGLPEGLRAAARAAGQECGEGDVPVITLSRSLIAPFLTFSTRRDLREKAFKAWIRRGENDGEHDNRPSRARSSRCATSRRACTATRTTPTTRWWTAWREPRPPLPACSARCGNRPRPARRPSARRWPRWRARSGATHAIEAWDWRHYAEKVRNARYGLDEAQLKPYFSLDRMLAAAFDTAQRLFGISFHERGDIPAYHPDVRVFEVRGRDGASLGVFLSDNYARPTKRGGAWMSAYRWQSRIDGETLPVIVNNNNFAKAPAGEPTLLSADDVRTLFHEFGHGLHGLLSQVTYERLSGTRCCAISSSFPRRSSSTGGSSRRC